AAPVLATSATTGEGLEELREHLVAIARSREAAAFRQRADLTAAADRLHEVADPAGLPAAADPADVDALAQDLAVAARVDEVATAVGSSYRYRAGNRVGWPPLRWLRRVRPDPLRRWNIGQQRDGPGLERTSLPEPDAASAARASGVARRFADASSAGGSAPWRAAVRGAARARAPGQADAPGPAGARTDLRRGRGARRWRAARGLVGGAGGGCAAVAGPADRCGRRGMAGSQHGAGPLPAPPAADADDRGAVDPDPAAHRTGRAQHRRRHPAGGAGRRRGGPDR